MNLSVIQQNTEEFGDNMNVIVPILPLTTTTAVIALQLEVIDNANLASGIIPIAFVPLGAVSSKVPSWLL